MPSNRQASPTASGCSKRFRGRTCHDNGFGASRWDGWRVVNGGLKLVEMVLPRWPVVHGCSSQRCHAQAPNSLDVCVGRHQLGPKNREGRPLPVRDAPLPAVALQRLDIGVRVVQDVLCTAAMYGLPPGSSASADRSAHAALVEDMAACSSRSCLTRPAMSSWYVHQRGDSSRQGRVTETAGG